MKPSHSVDEYIKQSSKSVQPILKKVRELIKKAEPKAIESISYGMPGYKLNGKPLVYFAANKEHLGIYALPSTHTAFKKELDGYVGAKGSVRFPYSKAIPYTLISKMVKYRAKEITKAPS